MLEIFISNQKVDLPTDIQIALTIENPMMLQDRVPAPYSLNLEKPIKAEVALLGKDGFYEKDNEYKNIQTSANL